MVNAWDCGSLTWKTAVPIDDDFWYFVLCATAPSHGCRHFALLHCAAGDAGRHDSCVAQPFAHSSATAAYAASVVSRVEGLGGGVTNLQMKADAIGLFLWLLGHEPLGGSLDDELLLDDQKFRPCCESPDEGGNGTQCWMVNAEQYLALGLNLGVHQGKRPQYSHDVVGTALNCTQVMNRLLSF